MVLCAVITGPTSDDVKAQMVHALKYAEMLEFRADCFNFSYLVRYTQARICQVAPYRAGLYRIAKFCLERL